MTHKSNRHQLTISTTEDQFLQLLDFSREKRAKRMMAEMHCALLRGESATEYMDDLGEHGYPESAVQDAFLGGYQIDIVQNENVNHDDWRQVLNGIGIPDSRIEQARSLLDKIMATYESVPRRIEAINALCGDVYVPPPAEIIDEIVPA